MDWFEYSQILLDKCKQKEIPFHCGFELTPLCNFRCNMCYIRLTPEQAAAQGRPLSTEQWIGLAKEAKKCGAVSMEVTGGEAMTRSDFPILYKAFIDMGFLIVLRSNGYLISGEILDLLKQNKPRKVIVTLYGASDETYEKVCSVSDGFSVVTKNLIALRNAGLTVQLTATITKENEDDVDAMQLWAKNNGFDLSLCGMLFTPIRGAKRSVDHLKIRLSDEVYELTDEMQAIQREIPNREFYMQHPFWMCRAFGAKFTITWDGRMTMCNSNPSIWKDPFENGLAEAYHALYRDLKAIHRPKECTDCKYIDLCSVCPSMLFSATGSMEQTCDEMCRIARRKFKTQVLMNAKHSGAANQVSDNICDEREDT